MTGAVPFSIAISLQPTRFDAVAYQTSLLDQLQYVSQLGFAGVELAVRDPSQIDLAALSKVLVQFGLVVPAIGTGQAWTDEGLSLTAVDAVVRDAARQRLHSHIGLAAHFNAAIIVGLIRGCSSPGVSRAQALDWLAAALVETAAAAQAVGVNLVVEPINRYETNLVNTIDEALDLLDRIGADNVRLLPDTFHMNIEEPSIEGSLRRAGARIGHFHVADSNRRFPGAGHLDFTSILGTLRTELAYGGWVSQETLPEPDPRAAAEEGLRHLRRSLPGSKS